MSRLLTVMEAIRLSREYLSKKGISEARANAELLLADILQCKRLDLYLMFDRPLSESEIERYRSYLIKRSNFEPLQYIIGKVNFFGMEFKVTKDVLIPRPETEILIEEILKTLKGKKGSLKILDIGTGSGNIAITLKKHLTEAYVLGIDVSPKALEIAGENAELNSVTGVDFKVADIFQDEIFELGKFDAVVSNPPYVAKEKIAALQKEIKDYEPIVALTDNADGYSFFRRIIKLSKQLLSEKGFLFFEVSENQGEYVRSLMNAGGFSNAEVIKDFNGMERIVKGELK